MNSTVYIESTVISYRSSRASRDLIVAAHQQITHEWWENERVKYDAFISPVVIDEISRGDAEAARERIEIVSSFPVLEAVPEVEELAGVYFSEIDIPEKARADSYHLALAAWHGMDFLVTWNCTHINGAVARFKYQEINTSRGIRSPIVCTPEELMEG